MKKTYLLLAVLFILSVTVRFYASSGSVEFSDSHSYFVLRQIEHIKSTGLPLYNDNLSYSGRFYPFMPLFYYFLAGVSELSDSISMLKLVISILSSLTIVATFLLSYEITRNRKASFIAAFSASLIPVFFIETINSLSEISLMLPLSLFVVLGIIKLSKDEKFTHATILLILMLILTGSASILILLALPVYFLLNYLEKTKLSNAEKEISIFAWVLFIWLNLIIYKKALLEHGFGIIRSNIPGEFLGLYFSRIGFFDIIFRIGIVPIIIGLIVTYKYLFKKKTPTTYLIVAICLTSLTATWLTLIDFITGLTLLGSFLTILLAIGIKEFLIILRKSKFFKFETIIIALIIVLICSTSGLMVYYTSSNTLKNVPSEELIDALLWLEENSSNNAIVLSNIEDGHLISYYSHRKNVLDTNYLLINDVDQRLNDVRKIYSTDSNIEAIRLLNKYKVNFILSDSASIPLFSKEDCFSIVYDSQIKILQNNCKLKK